MAYCFWTNSWYIWFLDYYVFLVVRMWLARPLLIVVLIRRSPGRFTCKISKSIDGTKSVHSSFGYVLPFFNDLALYDRLGFDGTVLPVLLAPAEFDLLLKMDRFIFAVPDSLLIYFSAEQIVVVAVVAALTDLVSDVLLSYSLDLALKSGDRDWIDRITSAWVIIIDVGVTLFRNATGSGCGWGSVGSYSSSDSLLNGIIYDVLPIFAIGSEDFDSILSCKHVGFIMYYLHWGLEIIMFLFLSITHVT